MEYINFQFICVLRNNFFSRKSYKTESVDKPGSVVDDHSSATGVTACL